MPVRRLITFFRAWEPRALAALIIVTAGAWGAFALGEAVREGETGRIDRWLLEIGRRPGDVGTLRGPSWFPEMVRDVTALGSVTVLSMATLGVAGFLWLAGKRKTTGFLLIATISGAVAVSTLKTLVARPRPDIVPHLAHVSSGSFPSGHSMMSAVIYLTLGGLVMAVVHGRMLKMYILGVAVGLTVLVGVSRVLLGVHYPSDVLAGWTIGLAWSEACWLIHAWWSGRLRVQKKLDEATDD
ncbi:MAG TPA: phosphatase PAP2 family protein [Caulifigura sp.]|jgi:undecaprenyl-diphosphatase|nr:phosphatase PAP2 family protein [Caulifigura sp.]